MRKFCAVISITALSSCNFPYTAADQSSDKNGDGFISPSEAQAAFLALEKIEFQGGKWRLIASSLGQTSEVDESCVTQKETRQFAQMIVFGDSEKEIRSAPNESCKFKDLQVSQNSVKIDISCEIADAQSTRKVESSFSSTSFETTQSLASNDWRRYGLNEGETYKKSVKLSASRLTAC